MKKIRLILPMLAVMVGGIGALATGATKSTLLAPLPVVQVQTNCVRTGVCSNEGTAACKTGPEQSIQLFEKTGPTTCNIAAVGIYTAD